MCRKAAPVEWETPQTPTAAVPPVPAMPGTVLGTLV